MCNGSCASQSGLDFERLGGSDVSQTKSPPHSGQSRTGNPPGSVGGKASTTMSSTQSACLQERQRYLNHSLGPIQGSSSGKSASSFGFVIREFQKEGLEVVLEDAVPGMFDPFEFHRVLASGTQEGGTAEALEEELPKGLAGEDAEASRVRPRAGRHHRRQGFAGPRVADVAVEAVVADALEALREDVLDHPPDEPQHREGGMFDLAGPMVAVPVKGM